MIASRCRAVKRRTVRSKPLVPRSAITRRFPEWTRAAGVATMAPQGGRHPAMTLTETIEALGRLEAISDILKLIGSLTRMRIA